jgi:hypothetical protein
MDDSKRMSVAEMGAFLAGAGPVEFCGQGRKEVYGWVVKALVQYEYTVLGKAGKGLERRYVEKMTGLSRAQVTRLIASYRETGLVKAAQYARVRLATRYTKGRYRVAGLCG